jgi:hypothetical protein
MFKITRKEFHIVGSCSSDIRQNLTQPGFLTLEVVRFEVLNCTFNSRTSNFHLTSHLLSQAGRASTSKPGRPTTAPNGAAAAKPGDGVGPRTTRHRRSRSGSNNSSLWSLPISPFAGAQSQPFASPGATRNLVPPATPKRVTEEVAPVRSPSPSPPPRTPIPFAGGLVTTLCIDDIQRPTLCPPLPPPPPPLPPPPYVINEVTPAFPTLPPPPLSFCRGPVTALCITEIHPDPDYNPATN